VYEEDEMEHQLLFLLFILQVVLGTALQIYVFWIVQSFINELKASLDLDRLSLNAQYDQPMDSESDQEGLQEVIQYSTDGFGGFPQEPPQNLPEG